MYSIALLLLKLTIELSENSLPIIIPWYVLIFMFTVGVSALFKLFIQTKKEFHIYKSGVESSGEILSMTQKQPLSGINLGKSVIVEYRYKTHYGNTVQGQSSIRELYVTYKKNIGDLLPIYISKENSEESIITPFLKFWL